MIEEWFIVYFIRRFVRFCFFLYFREKGFKRNAFKSIISPIQIKVSESKVLEKRMDELKRALKPTLIPIKDLTRVGSKFDGGYIVPKIGIKESDFLISGGISTNNDFELSLAKKGVLGLQIDFSIEAPPIKHANLSFVKKRLGDEISLKQAVKHFSSKGKGILKLDIEGSEYQVIKNFNQFFIFDLIIIEFHYLNRLIEYDFYSCFRNSLLKINSTHKIVYISPNNCCGYSIIGGQPIPNLLEITWLKKNLVNKKNNISSNNYRSLYRPNKPWKASLDISNLFPNW